MTDKDSVTAVWVEVDPEEESYYACICDGSGQELTLTENRPTIAKAKQAARDWIEKNRPGVRVQWFSGALR